MKRIVIVVAWARGHEVLRREALVFLAADDSAFTGWPELVNLIGE